MPYNLLLADDSVTIQRVIELTFADEDVKVIAVGDGQAAIDRIAADPPDIVLADVGMPVRDGYEVAAFVKDSPGLAHIPVLLLTGAFEPVDETRAKAVRCDGVLAKPFEPQLLIGRVKELLAGGAASAPGEAAPPEGPAAAEVHGATADASPRGWDDGDTVHVPVAAGGFTEADFALDTGTSVAAEPPTPVADVSLDDYFDRLDAAFANLSGAPAGQLKAATAARDLDTSWAPAPSGGWAEALEVGVPEAGAVAERPGEPPVSVTPATDAATRGAETVPVADAFAALLEAEQRGAVPPSGGGEVSMPAASLGSPVVTEAFIDQVVQRLADRLGGDALREAVVRIVSETAERLVREEIERLKAAASKS